MYKKNSLAYIYIRFIYKGEVNISILIFDFFNTQCIIYDTFSFFEHWRTLVADKTHFRQMASTEMIYSSCLTSQLSF